MNTEHVIISYWVKQLSQEGLECCSCFASLQNRNKPGVCNTGMGTGRQRWDGFLHGTSPKSGKETLFMITLEKATYPLVTVTNFVSANMCYECLLNLAQQTLWKKEQITFHCCSYVAISDNIWKKSLLRESQGILQLWLYNMNV